LISEGIDQEPEATLPKPKRTSKQLKPNIKRQQKELRNVLGTGALARDVLDVAFGGVRMLQMTFEDPKMDRNPVTTLVGCRIFDCKVEKKPSSASWTLVVMAAAVAGSGD